jgi:hypothetical protein
MSPQEPGRSAPTRGAGAGTPGKGTPVPVDLSGDPRAWTTIALFLAGPVIWSAHFMLVYLVVEAGCSGSGPGLRALDPPVPTVVTLAATVVAAVACLGCAAVAYRRWRAARQRADDWAALAPPDRGGSLAFAGFLLALLALVEVLFVGLPALVLPAC